MSSVREEEHYSNGCHLVKHIGVGLIAPTYIKVGTDFGPFRFNMYGYRLPLVYSYRLKCVRFA